MLTPQNETKHIQNASLVDNDTEKLLRSLARNLAAGLRTEDEIVRDHKLTYDAYARIAQHPAFQRILNDEVARWNAADNAEERVRMKFLTIVEEAAMPTYETLIDSKQPASGKSDLLKTCARLAKLIDREDAGAAAAGRVIINIGVSPTKTVTAKSEPQAITLEGNEILTP